MATKTKSKKKGIRVKRSAPTAQKRASARAKVSSMGLDQAALSWRHLLQDPCGAQIVPSCYSGSGTGYYVRTRANIFVGNNTSGIYTFLLGQNSVYNYATASVPGAVSFSAPAAIFQNGNILGRGASFRCLAGCVKVKYIGAESSRAGLIGLSTGSHPMGEANQTALPPFTDYIPNFTMMSRTGETLHEAKWIPTSTDENFATVITTVAPLVPPGATGGEGSSAIHVLFNATPASSLMFEITAVYEYDPSQATGGNAVVMASVPPRSSNTLNQVLRSLGPATTWAYNTIGVPVIKAAAGYASNILTTAAAQVNPIAPLLSVL